MKNKRLFIISVSVLFFLNNILGQAPGYIGKKLIIGYGLNASPALYGANANNKTVFGTEGNAESGKLAFNFIQEGFIEYATSAKWMIGFSARYYKTVFDNPTFMPDKNREVQYSSRQHPNGYYTIKGLTYSFYCKVFRPGYVAPWGKYIMFGPVFNTAKASYNPAIMNIVARTGYNDYYNGNYDQRDTLISDFGPTVQSYKGFNFMLGFGKSRIIANRIVLDYGFNMYLLSFFPNIALTYKDDITAGNYIEKTISRRVRGINHFNAFIKVGLLLI